MVLITDYHVNGFKINEETSTDMKIIWSHRLSLSFIKWHFNNYFPWFLAKYIFEQEFYVQKQHIRLQPSSGNISCMRPANERRRYIVTSSLIGWVHTQKDPCQLHDEIMIWKHSHKFST